LYATWLLRLAPGPRTDRCPVPDSYAFALSFQIREPWASSN